MIVPAVICASSTATTTRAVGILALQHRPGAVDRIQLLPDWLATARCGVWTWARVCAQHGVLLQDAPGDLPLAANPIIDTRRISDGNPRCIGPTVAL